MSAITADIIIYSGVQFLNINDIKFQYKKCRFSDP